MKAADCVDLTEQRMQGVGWLCGTHCWACLGLDCHEFRMPLQLHALKAEKLLQQLKLHLLPRLQPRSNQISD